MNRRELIKSSVLSFGPLILAPRSIFEFFTPKEMTRADFGKDFRWGAASAAFQIEGAWNDEQKGPSIWDTFNHIKHNIKTRENGDVACDFYHCYNDDLAILKSLNMNAYRFSISWSRILPDGAGAVNAQGLAFYHKVIDACLELGIEPWITLYHWDLPQALQNRGGWVNREIVEWFANYVDIVTKEYGHKVKHWMVLNEPLAFTALGYLLGQHAPGKMGFRHFFPAVHHTTLCQAEGGRVIRKNVPDAQVGTTFSCSFMEPKTNKERDIKAARRMDALINRLFIEPALGMGYPVDGWKQLKKLSKYMLPGDEEKMKFDFDFIGIQNYFRTVARFAIFPPIMWANQVPAKKLGHDVTEMGWEVSPEGIYKILKQFAAYKGVKKIVVTENGVAFPDKLEGDRVHDPRRVQFFKDYLANVLKAKQEGIDIGGYFVWSLTDNFEWADGYKPRFGLVYVNYPTEKRTIKDSGLWFREFLKQ